ncbi:hypothetical protein F2Q69_00036967 [Brassica cretica]|uniref:Uncharacterized protein n=1 Tax=Brassica cretica TaxID=69181 RepID=A0A8S9SNJ2_BRACR|nr:hypothetical protein F2Q69_00036967 [Brassica cretica]
MFSGDLMNIVTLMPATISANRVPTLSSSVGEKEIEFVCLKKGKEKLNKATRIPSFILMKTSRKIINQGVPTSFSCQGRSDRLEGFQPTLGSKGVKKIYKQCEKMGSNSKRLFGEKDEIVLLQVQGEASDYDCQRLFGGAEVIAFESAIGKSKESKKRVTKKHDLASSRNGKNAQDSSKRGDMEKSPHVVTKSDWNENSFFLGMKDKCVHDKLELLNEVTSTIMAAD